MGEAAPPPERELTELEGLQLKCNQARAKLLEIFFPAGIVIESLPDMCKRQQQNFPI